MPESIHDWFDLWCNVMTTRRVRQFAGPGFSLNSDSMATIPRFLVCIGNTESAAAGAGEFLSVPIPLKTGATRTAALMFSTAEKAREFIASNPGEWHVRQLDQRTLRAFLIDPRNLAGIDSVVIDFINTGVPSFIQGFDADAGAKALEANGYNDDELAAVESWTVFL